MGKVILKGRIDEIEKLNDSLQYHMKSLSKVKMSKKMKETIEIYCMNLKYTQRRSSLGLLYTKKHYLDNHIEDEISKEEIKPIGIFIRNKKFIYLEVDEEHMNYYTKLKNPIISIKL